MAASTNLGRTPLMAAAVHGAADCVKLLIAHVRDGIDGQQGSGSTALHLATYHGYHHVISLLVRAGANPTIQNAWGETALYTAQSEGSEGHHQCYWLLKVALVEPQRPRALFKARAAARGLGPTEGAAVARGGAGSARLSQRSSPARRVQLVEQGVQASTGEDQDLAACLKYALGLEVGGGVVFEGKEPRWGCCRRCL